MTTTSTSVDARAASLRGLCAGAIHLPGDPGYDEARMPWNVAVDQRPAAVAYPGNADEVSAVVRAAAEAGLRVAPQGTGHNAGPLGSLEDVVLLRTSAMTAVTIDADRQVARVEAGALWLDAVEPAAQAGLAALHGSSPDVGVVGYSLGGGLGWYARKLGLATNSVTAVEVVIGDGSIVRADETPTRSSSGRCAAAAGASESSRLSSSGSTRSRPPTPACSCGTRATPRRSSADGRSGASRRRTR